MDSRIVIPLIVIVLLFVIVGAVILGRRRSSAHLKEKFGPEYDRTVQQHGSAHKAEAVLSERAKRVDSFKIHELPGRERDQYGADWTDVQRRFVDDPRAAVIEADRLVTKVMSARGYPMGDFAQRASDISVSYPEVVQDYRAARAIVVRHNEGKSSTEDLRQAMVHYRSLFDELLGKGTERGATHG